APLKLIDLTGVALPGSCGVDANGTAEIDAHATFTPVIDLEVKVGPKGPWNPISELKRFRFVASGKLDVSAALRGTGTVTGHCTVVLLEMAGGALSIPLPTLTFWAGPVPVIVTSEVAPKVKADVGLSFTAVEMQAQAQTTMSMEAGVDYQNHD